jgi:hypothetical protein
MSVADQKMYDDVKIFLERQKIDYIESEEQYCCKFTVKNGSTTAHISVFNSGKIVVGGKDGTLRETLNCIKDAVENATTISNQTLPLEIERYPEVILENSQNCDPVIISFIREAILCYKSNAILATAFMLGAASEKAISALIDQYANSILDETNRNKFQQRINSRLISKKWDEFTKSYAGSKNKPTDPVLGQDIDTILGTMFQFFRITRNEVGHPQVVPNIDKGVILAHMGQFVHYIKRIYDLSEHFRVNGIEV